MEKVISSIELNLPSDGKWHGPKQWQSLIENKSAPFIWPMRYSLQYSGNEYGQKRSPFLESE